MLTHFQIRQVLDTIPQLKNYDLNYLRNHIKQLHPKQGFKLLQSEMYYIVEGQIKEDHLIHEAGTLLSKSTGVTIKDSHLLQFSRDDLINTDKRHFIAGLFADYQGFRIDKVINLFKELIIYRHTIIKPQELYIVYEGDVMLEKRDQSKFKKVCILNKGSFLGEESILGIENIFRGVCESHQATVFILKYQEISALFPDWLQLQHHLEMKLILSQMNNPQTQSVTRNISPQGELKQHIVYKKQIYRKFFQKQDQQPVIIGNFFHKNSLSRKQILDYNDKSSVLLGFHNRQLKMQQTLQKPKALTQRKRANSCQKAVKQQDSIPNIDFNFFSNYRDFLPAQAIKRQS